MRRPAERAVRTSPTRRSTSSVTSTIPGHVEVQILADATVPSSISASVTARSSGAIRSSSRRRLPLRSTRTLRARIGSIAVDAARAVDYRSAGTIEGLLTPDGSYYFLEMNTRIQVEHTDHRGRDRDRSRPGADPDRSRRASFLHSGGRSSCAGTPSSAVSTQRTSRVGFLPTPGRIDGVSRARRDRRPRRLGGPAGDEISDLYDPLIAKLVVHDTDREKARRRALRALEEFVVVGPTTLIGFHRALLSSRCFVEVTDLPRPRGVRGACEARAGAERFFSCLMSKQR